MRFYAFLLFLSALMAVAAPAQEIHLQTCDILPVAEVSISGARFLFLVDTAATSFLNSRSFAFGPELKIPVTSWSGTTETTGQRVTVHDLSVAGRHLRDVQLPAVDLSGIGRACGRRLDGIFGVDLLHAFGASVEFDGEMARLLVRHDDPHDRRAAFDRQFATCGQSLSRGDERGLLGCLDEEVTLVTDDAHFHGRANVLEYLKQKYGTRNPSAQLSVTMQTCHVLGEGMWAEYEMRVATVDHVIVERGSALWHEVDGQWRALYVNHPGVPREERRDTSN